MNYIPTLISTLTSSNVSFLRSLFGEPVLITDPNTNTQLPYILVPDSQFKLIYYQDSNGTTHIPMIEQLISQYEQ